MSSPQKDAIAAHGGTLINRDVSPDAREEWISKSKSLLAVPLGPREISDLELIASGGFSPLTGFMTRDDYTSVIGDMSLANGLPWTIPITLSVGEELEDKVKPGQDLVLVDESGTPLAILHAEEVFPSEKQKEAQEVYKTTEEAHPGVAALYRSSKTLVGGPVTVLTRPPILISGPTASTRRRRAPPSGSGGGGASLVSRHETRCTGPTSTFKSVRWRSSTDFFSTRLWERRRATTSPPTCACDVTR